MNIKYRIWRALLLLSFMCAMILNSDLIAQNQRWIDADGTIRQYWKIGKNAGEIKWNNDSTLYYLRYNAGADSAYFVYTKNPKGDHLWQDITGRKWFKSKIRIDTIDSQNELNILSDLIPVSRLKIPGWNVANYTLNDWLVAVDGSGGRRLIFGKSYSVGPGTTVFDTLAFKSEIPDTTILVDTAKVAVSLMGGAANKIPYQTAPDTTGFIDAPADSSKILYGNLKWKDFPVAVADGSTKGIATFTANDFNASSGNISLDYTNMQKGAADGSTKGIVSFTAVDFDASSGNISIDYTNGQAASSGAKGFLTAADWSTFNNKADANQTMYIGTTALTINRGSGAQSLTGITSIDGNAETVTAAADATNAARYVFFGTAASGSLPLKTSESIKFNPSTGILTAYGLAVTTDLAVTAKLSAGQFVVPSISGGYTGALYYDGGLKYYNGLTTEQFAWVGQTMYVGTTALTINRGSGAQSLTGITSIDGNAATVTAAADATNAARYVFFGTAASGSLPLKTSESIKFNPSTGILTAYGLAVTTDLAVTAKLSAGQFVIPSISGGYTGALYYDGGLKYYNGLTTEQFAWVGQTMYIGTTSVAINRASAALVLTGITSIDGNAATVTNGVYTNANNSLSGNNTLTGALILDGEKEVTPSTDENCSVSGENTVIFYMTDAYTVTITDPTDGQALFVSNDKDSPANLILTPVRNGVNSSLTLAAGKSVTIRYRTSESTWYSTTP